jgi:hypothetical protein
MAAKDRLLEGMIFIRFTSHRARDCGLRAILRCPDAYYSFRRKSGPGGIYAVSPEEADTMRKYSSLVHFTRLRGPYDDLRRCING